MRFRTLLALLPLLLLALPARAEPLMPIVLDVPGMR
jgi:hypothetical protein